jgi:hypothetical protein
MVQCLVASGERSNSLAAMISGYKIWGGGWRGFNSTNRPSPQTIDDYVATYQGAFVPRGGEGILGTVLLHNLILRQNPHLVEMMKDGAGLYLKIQLPNNAGSKPPIDYE